jgi:hypothetical protein
MAVLVIWASRCDPVVAAVPLNPTLSDVSFGPVASLYSDLTSRQNTCSFSGLTPTTYGVTATGSGPSGAFAISNGTTQIAYEVQWAQSANATSGSPVSSNQPLLNQSNSSLLSTVTCALGLQNATLIIIVRAPSLQQATTGSYSGSLSILLTPQ